MTFSLFGVTLRIIFESLRVARNFCRSRVQKYLLKDKRHDEKARS